MTVDRQLIRRCRRADERAQLELYKLCYGHMMGLCSRYIQQAADRTDVMNRGFLKILQSLDQYDTERPFLAWMTRIMVNTALDYHRKRQRLRHVRSVDPTEQHLLQNENHRDFNTAHLEYEAEELLEMIRELPERTSQVFNLYAIDGFRHEEIAEMLGISKGTSKWHVSKAREMLRRLLLKQDIKEEEFS